MPLITITINDRKVAVESGQTILAAAQQGGIYIPTLCHDERVKMYGSCGLCVVEAEKHLRLVRACSTLAADGMVIKTNTERVKNTRKAALELLFSDHKGDCRAPCVLACPGHTDCQGYVGLIANKQYREAAALIREKLPLPSSIGRVCPHPCETACRRELVEEPISIAHLKSFVSDTYLDDDDLVPEIACDTGKTVAVIGGGPGGLTAAYFLRKLGHAVTVYDAMPHMGGMLRYGIPEYRLPKNVLDKEIAIIEKTGVRLITNTKIGTELTLDYLQKNYDAVVIAIGAWSSMALRCPGENSNGVFGGIDFLRAVAFGNVALNNPPQIGNKVAIVGGGNTAMDACRTAVRLGAKEVYNVYRRSRAEMPAEEIEIEEAEEEGVVFKYLTNPIEIIADNGRVSKIRLQKMQLGEPDASGRRSPVPIEGAEETLAVDSVIIAIGQTANTAGFEDITLTKWKTIAADAATFRTNLDGVFAVGDATNNGADIAIAAIGEAYKAVTVIDSYLNGKMVGYTEPYLVKSNPTADDFADREKSPRVKMRHQYSGDRKNNFNEVNFGFSVDEAVNEAKRCLECGCADFFECQLIAIANDHYLEPAKYEGESNTHEVNNDHPYIYRNPEKCILCGLCVRICDELIGVTALGLVDRGFDTAVKPAFNESLEESGCISCGQCVTVCPTGAITEKITAYKQVPVSENITHTVCSFCSVGCKIKITTKGSMLLRCLPDDSIDKKQILCEQGRFGFIELLKKERITTPLVENKKTDLSTACARINQAMRDIIAQHGAEAAAVTVSGRLTNEEISLAKQYAASLGIRMYSFSRRENDPAGADFTVHSVIKASQAGGTRHLPQANSRGLADLGIGYAGKIIGKITEKKLKGLIAFGDDVDEIELSGLEFLCIGSVYMTETAKKANVVLPFAGFAESEGTYTNTAGQVQKLNRTLPPVSGYTNGKILQILLEEAGKSP
ncbi:MAG: FAD-dependent oxidoreductase [Treponema sp.]|nr:FAD-dependent oxidoreductase [Treponema sp.]